MQVPLFRLRWMAPAVVLINVVAGFRGLEAGAADSSTAAPWPFAVTAGQRPGTYWWCPGSAFSIEDIDWNLKQLHDAGFGFVHVVPIYGAKGAEAQAIPYLSPRWMEMFEHIVRRAKSLGMFVDMTTGTGWCFGGPNLPNWAIDVKACYEAKSRTVRLAPAARVKRAAPGGEGPMINPFSPRAMNLYLERFSAAFDAFPNARPRAQYHDSFEYRGDWSEELFDEFQSRMGYDLREYLPLFFDDSRGDDESRARLKYDYRRVLAELHWESIRRWSAWAHDRGMLTRNQAHGAPANLLDLYAASDIPDMEMFGASEFPIPGFRRDPAMVRSSDDDARICMLASSATHVAHPPGKQLVGAETCTWLREHWHTSLAHIKLQIDLFFLTGANQLLFHGTCYSPRDVPWPGWFFYASIKMDWRNAFWRDVPVLTQYVARCQSVLQAGQHANEVLLYWPIHDLWMDACGTTIPLTVHRREWMANQPVGETANFFLRRGFAFDFISDRMVAESAVRDGMIITPGGAYRALVVPPCRYMPEETFTRLTELAQAGAAIIFQRRLPDDVPGRADLARRRTRFIEQRAMAKQNGVILTDDIERALTAAQAVREPMVDRGLRFVRRKVDADTWYFIANHTAEVVDDWIVLGSPCSEAARFDAMTGASGRLPVRKRDGRTEVYLRLEPGQTTFVRTGADAAMPPWRHFRPCGEPVVLSGTWSVEFIEGGPVLPAAYRTGKLASWTEAPDVAAQAFAGTARYVLEFPAPPMRADAWLLDLGDVRHSARVRLNGRDLGTLVALPFSVLLDHAVQKGRNRLEIEVTNLSANRIRDLDLRNVDWKIMKDINIVNVHYQAFDASHWPIEPSGLLGPVRLVPLEVFDPAAK